MSDTFDIARVNDRTYDAPSPWSRWDDYHERWLCHDCGALAIDQIHSAHCSLLKQCRKCDAALTAMATWQRGLNGPLCKHCYYDDPVEIASRDGVLVRPAPQIHIANHYGSEQIVAALSSNEGRRVVSEALDRLRNAAATRKQAERDLDRRDTYGSTNQAEFAPNFNPLPPVWLVVTVALVAIGALSALAWLMR